MTTINKFRWATGIIQELEGLSVCIENGCYKVGTTRYFDTSDIIKRALRLIGGDVIW